MTDTESAAVRVWALLVRADVPPEPHLALDLVMEAGRGCEIGEALSALHVAAAGWVQELQLSRNVDWDTTPTEIAWRISEGVLDLSGSGGLYDPLATMRSHGHCDPSRHERWLAWCNRADRALSILRACRAVAEGVTT